MHFETQIRPVWVEREWEKKRRKRRAKRNRVGEAEGCLDQLGKAWMSKNEQVSIPFFSRCRYAYACEYRLFLLCKCALNPLTPMILFSTPTLSLEKKGSSTPFVLLVCLLLASIPAPTGSHPPFSLSLLSPIRRIAECKCISVQVQRN